MSSYFYDLSRVQYQYFICIFNSAESVGYNKNCFPGVYCFQGVYDCVLANSIQ